MDHLWEGGCTVIIRRAWCQWGLGMEVSEAKLLKVESTAMSSLSQTRAGNATLVVVIDTSCHVNFFKHLRQCFITNSRLKVLGNSI